MLARCSYLVAAAFAGLMLLCAAITSAATVGGPVVRISPASGYSGYPVLGVDARGDQTAAWTDYQSSSPAQFSVVISTHRFGSGGWSRPAEVSAVTEGPDVPALAIAPSGAGAIAWTQTVSVGKRHAFVTNLEMTTRASVSAAWRRPVSISARGEQVSRFGVGIDRRGQATIVWNRGFGTNPPIESAIGSTASGRWSRPRQLAAAGHGGLDPQLAVNPGGDTLVAWARQIGRINHRNYQPTIRYAEMATYRAANRGWQQPTRIGRLSELLELPGGNVWGPATPTIAVDARGGATVMWQSSRGNEQVLDAAHRSAPTTRWNPPVALAMNATAPVIGTAASGDLSVVWTDRRGRILTRVSSNGRTWTPPIPVPGAARAFLTWLSIAPNGHAILTWSGAHARVFISERNGPRTQWTPPVVLGRGGLPQASLDGHGNATLIWPSLLPRPRFGAIIDTTSYPANKL